MGVTTERSVLTEHLEDPPLVSPDHNLALTTLLTPTPTTTSDVAATTAVVVDIPTLGVDGHVDLCYNSRSIPLAQRAFECRSSHKPSKLSARSAAC